MCILTATLSTALTLLLAVSASAQTPDPPTLHGTSWQLVRFQGGDDAVLTPKDGSRYTITFGDDGRVSARIDCNRVRAPGRPAGRASFSSGRSH